jgi:hypothetical protein
MLLYLKVHFKHQFNIKKDEYEGIYPITNFNMKCNGEAWVNRKCKIKFPFYGFVKLQ